ncbi:MAG TPA: family 16 glycosylhydrolase [Pricia sp.]|nr:family 16 glycosylhydrolase [Pricia sp.]
MMKFTPIVISHISYLQNCTVHTKAYNQVTGTEKGGSVFIENPYSEFHVYSVERTPEQIDFLLDG